MLPSTTNNFVEFQSFLLVFESLVLWLKVQ